MYTKEEREGILWEFHRSGLSAPAACRSLPLFPNKDNLYAWLKLEEAGELTAREMPDRAERMHCSHGEGSPAFAARRPGTEPASPRKRRAEGGAGKMERTGRGGAGGEPPEQTDWRDWGLEGLPDDPAERAREAEVRLAVRLDGYRAYLSPAIDCFAGWPICWRVSVHADSDLMVGMLRDLVGIVGPTEDRPLTVHTDGGAVYMGREWREACGPGVVRSMSRRARSPDNARAEGFFGTLKCDFFEGRDWTGVPFDEFSRLLGEYIEWYRDGKLKKDLGWKTIREYREERGHAA